MNLDLPLHPIAVHFPIALGVLIPLLGIVVFLGIKKKIFTQTTWSLLVFLGFVYFGSALFASHLGEEDEEKVEQVVQEQYIEEHEEAGEKVPWAAGIVLIGLTIPLFIRKDGAYITALVVSGLAVAPLLKAGHTGGALVYKNGATKAYQDSQD